MRQVTLAPYQPTSTESADIAGNRNGWNVEKQFAKVPEVSVFNTENR